MSTTTQWILELVDKITGPMKDVIGASEKAAKGVDEVGDKAEESGKKLKNMSAIDLQAINQSVRQLADDFNQLNAPGASFNSQLKDLEALTGVTGDALDELADKGRATAKAFGGGPDAASAIMESYKGILSRLGPDIAKDSDALDLMGRNVATLSKTMGNDAVGSMDALTTSMLQFGVDLSDPMKAAQDMTTMMNVMAAGAKEGAAEVPSISDALKVAGVQAKSSKVDFIETNAAIQALAQGGKYGAEAGTALRNVLSKMAGIDIVPKEAAEKLEALGVNYDIVSNKTLPFTTRLRELKKAQGDATVMAQIFGVENAAAAEILLRSVDYQDQLQTKITGTNTAVEQANIVMSGYNERMSRVKTWFTDIAIGMFDVTSKIAPFIDGLAGTVMIMANLANARTGVILLFDTLKTMPVVGKIVTWGSTLVTGGFTAMSAGAKALGVAIMNIPIIGWIAAIVAGLAALAAYFYNTSATFRGFLWGLWDAVKTVFTGVWGFIKEVAGGILQLLKGVFNPVNWFDSNYSFTAGFDQIANAAASYGKAIGLSFSKGKADGMADFPSASTSSASGATIKNPSPVIKLNDLNPPTSTSSVTGASSRASHGSSSGIKNISQKIDIKNYFTVSGSNSKAEIESIAERVVRAINEKLGDGIVAAT